jgi:hypothetical protein
MDHTLGSAIVRLMCEQCDAKAVTLCCCGLDVVHVTLLK